MIEHDDEDEVTFYNWDEYNFPTPSQKLEIREYLALKKEQHRVSRKTPTNTKRDTKTIRQNETGEQTSEI